MSKEALRLALEALKQIDEAMPFPVAKFAQAAIREALAEQPAQQEPVGHVIVKTYSAGSIVDFEVNFDAVEQLSEGKHPVYTSPPARKPLTDEFLRKLHHVDQFGLFCDYDDFEQIARAIEAKLKEKNT